MPKRSPVDLEKHTVRLRHGDMDRIKERYPRMSANAIVRAVISHFVDAVDPDILDEEAYNNLVKELESDI